MKNRKDTTSHFGRNDLIRDVKKYRYYFFDYLYYRLYVVYKKHNEPARFSACCVFAATTMVMLLFVGIFVNHVLTDHWLSLKNFTASQGSIAGGCVSVLLFFAFYWRYTGKRTAAILLKYKGNKWNKILPTWMIYFSPLWVLLIGIGICRWILD